MGQLLMTALYVKSAGKTLSVAQEKQYIADLKKDNFPNMFEDGSNCHRERHEVRFDQLKKSSVQ